MHVLGFELLSQREELFRACGRAGDKKASSDRLQQYYSCPCEWLPFHLDCSQLSWIMKSQERDGSA